MDLTLDEVKAGVREEMDTIREVISDEAAQKFESVDKSIKDIQTELNKKQAAGEDPGAETVKDLEARMDVAEVELAEVKEQARLKIATPAIPQKPEDVDFKGVFIKDQDAVRNIMRQGGYAQSRAIDSSVISSAGVLNPQQADAFIDFVVAQQVGIGEATIIRLMSPQGYTEELRLASRKMVAATEATAPTVADGVTAARRTMTTVEVIWAEDLTLTFLEDNIERRGAEGHIARLLATGFGNDSNDLAWNGDATDSDAFIGINNGWIKIATGDSDVNDVTSYGSAIDTTTEVMHELWKSVPTKFLGRTDYVFFVPVTFAQNYAEEVSARLTGLGDQVLVNGFPALRYFGKRVIPEPHLATASGYVVVTPTANLHFGIQRAITVDSEWNPRKRVVEYTITARTDYEYATGEAIVLGANVTVGMS